MKYEVFILLEIDPDATFLGVDSSNTHVDLYDQINAVLYDIDDVEVLDLTLKGPVDDF